MHSISTRVSLAWDEEPPFEDSEVLVIVGKKYYVDIRLRRSPDNDYVIDWAMAGVKEWLHTEADSQKARFTPILTTRSELQDTTDEGTFTTLENGDILETGEMLDPNTGRIRRYSEVWRDLPINKGSVFILEGTGTADPSIQRAWVAKMGNYQAAVAKISDGRFLAWTAERVGGRPGWDVTKYSGPADAAGAVLPIDDPSPLWDAGTMFEANGIAWLVKEAFMT